MQICSFLPSATEILYALGLGDSVAGVTFECDFPPEAAGKSIVVNTNLAHDLTSTEIDNTVNDYTSHGEGLYRIDIGKLQAIKPDLVVTQELCDVCAISTSSVAKAVHQLSSKPQVLSLTPHTLGDVLEDVLRVGEATNRDVEARELVSSLRERIAKVSQMPKPQKPTVVCLEWLSPPFNGGHWIPEMIDLSGGVDPLGRLGKDSYRMEWDQVFSVNPDVVLVMPCGHNLERSSRRTGEAITPSRARIQLKLPLTVLISPLCAIMRYGCASSQEGKVLVEKRWCTIAIAETTRASARSR